MIVQVFIKLKMNSFHKFSSSPKHKANAKVIIITIINGLSTSSSFPLNGNLLVKQWKI